MTRIRRCFDSQTQVSYYISTVILTVAEFAQAIRLHWGIENCNHYVRDITLGEDHSRIRTNPHLFAKLRSFSLHILHKNHVANVSSELFQNGLNLDRVLRYIGFL